jgi:hypothetical protein
VDGELLYLETLAAGQPPELTPLIFFPCLSPSAILRFFAPL